MYIQLDISMDKLRNTLASTVESAQVAGASLLPSGSLAPSVAGGLLYAKDVERSVKDEQRKIEEIAAVVQKVIAQNKQELGKGYRG